MQVAKSPKTKYINRRRRHEKEQKNSEAVSEAQRGRRRKTQSEGGKAGHRYYEHCEGGDQRVSRKGGEIMETNTQGHAETIEKTKLDLSQNLIPVMDCFTTEPPALDFILPGLLLGSVGGLVSPGGTGKSMLAMQIGCDVARGKGTSIVGAVGAGKVLYISAEDLAVVLHHRCHKIGSMYSTDERSQIAANLTLMSLVGRRCDIQNTDWINALYPYMSETKLIVIDTLSRVHTEDENNNGQMAGLLSLLEALASNTGAAIMFLHHTSKMSALQGQGEMQQAARGASALIDNARWCGYVQTMSKEDAKEIGITETARPYYMRYGVSKQNYCAPIAPRWLHRTKDGVLEWMEMMSPEAVRADKSDKGRRYARL